MTAEIVNLKRARKAKARAEKEAKAAANRVRSGRTKDERLRDVDAVVRAARKLAGHRLGNRGDDDGPAGDGGGTPA